MKDRSSLTLLLFCLLFLPNAAHAWTQEPYLQDTSSAPLTASANIGKNVAIFSLTAGVQCLNSGGNQQWSYPLPNQTSHGFLQSIAASALGQTYATLHDENVGNNKRAILTVFGANGFLYRWEAPFTYFSSSFLRQAVAVSADGKVIVTVLYEDSAIPAKTHIQVFKPTQSTPVAEVVLTNFTVRGETVMLNATGTQLVLASTPTGYVYNIDSAHNTVALKGSFSIPGSYAKLAMSQDGSKVLIPGIEQSWLFGFNPTYSAYSLLMTINHPGWIGSASAFSIQGKYLGIGYKNWEQTQVKVEILDLAATVASHLPVTVRSDLFSSNAAHQFYVTKFSFSWRDNRVAVALSGDQGQSTTPAPEIVLYDLSAGTMDTFDFPGSPLSLDMSPRGVRVYTGIKAAHLDSFASGGQAVLIQE